jgi:hypothetical protein
VVAGGVLVTAMEDMVLGDSARNDRDLLAIHRMGCRLLLVL